MAVSSRTHTPAGSTSHEFEAALSDSYAGHSLGYGEMSRGSLTQIIAALIDGRLPVQCPIPIHVPIAGAGADAKLALTGDEASSSSSSSGSSSSSTEAPGAATDAVSASSAMVSASASASNVDCSSGSSSSGSSSSSSSGAAGVRPRGLRFIDIGSGAGRPTLHAALGFAHAFEQVCVCVRACVRDSVIPVCLLACLALLESEIFLHNSSSVVSSELCLLDRVFHPICCLLHVFDY